jgi:SAM-dependent methyltransferase
MNPTPGCLYSTPPHSFSEGECEFYHTIDLPGRGVIDGQWDLRNRISDYTGGIELAGKRVLDIGTASGFLTFEMEKQGADVVSFEADCGERVHKLPVHGSKQVTHPEASTQEISEFLVRLRNSYWMAHKALGSKAQAVYGDVYALPKTIGLFDVVVVGQILIHLRDPLAALTSIASQCRDILVLTEGFVSTDERIAELAGSVEGPDWMWWQWSIGTASEVLRMLGFGVVKREMRRYRCNNEYCKGEVPLWTLVAKKHREPARFPRLPPYQPIHRPLVRRLIDAFHLICNR